MFKKNLPSSGGAPSNPRRFMVCAVAAALFALCLGCRSLPPLASANLSEPGWTVLQGQAVWRKGHGASEIAGDLLVATHNGGQSMVQFTKSPFPLIIARTTTNMWQIEAPMENRRFARRGEPPNRVIWFQLPRAIAGGAIPADWIWQSNSNDWTLSNKSTGERIAGFLESK